MSIVLGAPRSCEFWESYDVLRTGRPHRWQVSGPDGSVIDVNDFPFTDTDGSPMILEMALDITEQKRAQERLAYQANLLENVNDAIMASDTELRITEWNHAAEDLYGWKAEEVIGANVLGVVRSQFSAEQRAAANRMVFETGHWRGEVTHLRRDGTPIMTEGTTIVLRDAAGRTTGYASVHRDITERKRADEAIRQQSERLAILHEIDHAILATRAPAEIAQSVVEHVRQATGALRVAVAVYDCAAGEAAILATAGLDSSLIPVGSRWPLSAGWMIDEVRAGRVATVVDVSELPDSDPFKATRLKEGIRSAALLPLKVGEQVIGQLNIHRAEPGGLGLEDMSLATHVADSLAIAIHNARLNEELFRRQAELTQANEALRYQAELLANVNDAIVAYDMDLRITAWNHRAEEQYGWTTAEALGGYAPAFVGSQTAADDRAAIVRKAADLGRWKGEEAEAHAPQRHTHHRRNDQYGAARREWEDRRSCHGESRYHRAHARGSETGRAGGAAAGTGWLAGSHPRRGLCTRAGRHRAFLESRRRRDVWLVA